MKPQFINGWTEERFLARIKENFKDGATKCIDGGTICLYRKDESCLNTAAPACVVGCFIPDDVYSEEMEGVGVAGLQRVTKDLSWAPLPQTDL